MRLPKPRYSRRGPVWPCMQVDSITTDGLRSRICS